MLGVYFSGSGNSRHCLEVFLKHADASARSVSIEDKSVLEAIDGQEFIVFAYPVYFSNLPKIFRDFIDNNAPCFKNKQIFIIATMGIFSGDGAGCAARLFSKHGAKIIGGLHLKMPDCISDEKLLKNTIEQNRAMVKKAESKIENAVYKLKTGAPTKEGLGVLYQIAGLFGQRFWFYFKTLRYSDKLKIDKKKCNVCGLCTELCPLENLEIASGEIQTKSHCTMCYRCVNNCPKQAITLLGSKIYEQILIEKYL